MRRRHASLLLTAATLGLGWWAVRLMGGTFSAVTHVMYVPVITAAIAFGPGGGVVVGLLAGIIMGATPQVMATGQLQSWLSVGIRTVVFIGVGGLVGHAILRLRRQQREMQGLMIQSVTALTRAMAETHPHTAGHSLRVSEIGWAMGHSLGQDEGALFLLRLGGLLHDIGKLAVPTAILDKPGRLTPDEFRQVQEHVSAGDRILEAFDYARVAAIHDIVRHHHERLDGSGYPDRLQGSQISLNARIVAVADVYDALTSSRPYRLALSHADAMAVLREEAAGCKLDARLVELVEAVARPAADEAAEADEIVV
jgi:putative nucleotidyltransferase with HDIG domain